MTQGDSVSPIFFNVVMDAVVRSVLLEVCGLQEAQHELGWETGEHNIVFYGEYSCIAGHKTIWVQKNLTVVVIMFEGVDCRQTW